MPYTKDTPRISVKIYDSKTEELLITINDRNWMNVGEIFTQNIVTSLINDEFKNKKKTKPQKIIMMIAEEYTLND